jgi:hypothetical protein
MVYSVYGRMISTGGTRNDVARGLSCNNQCVILHLWETEGNYEKCQLVRVRSSSESRSESGAYQVIPNRYCYASLFGTT